MRPILNSAISKCSHLLLPIGQDLLVAPEPDELLPSLDADLQPEEKPPAIECQKGMDVLTNVNIHAAAQSRLSSGVSHTQLPHLSRASVLDLDVLPGLEVDRISFTWKEVIGMAMST